VLHLLAHRLEFGPDRPHQPCVARQPQHVLDPMRLTPRHDRLAREARVSANPDLHLGPAGSDLAHDELERFDASRRTVEVAAPQLAPQHEAPTEDVERQVAVVAVVVVEEATLLLAVERIVRGIEIQHDPQRRPGVGVQEVIHKPLLDRGPVVDELVVARGRGGRALQTVERSAPGQRMTAIAGLTALGPQQIRLAGRQRQQGIVAQPIVIVEVLVAQRLPKHALPQQLLDRVLDPLRTTVVGEARGKPADQPRALGHLAQQQNARVRTLVPPVERGLHPPAREPLKLQLSRTTLCLHRADLLVTICLSTTNR
jgi:hypothetical protein